MRPTRGESGSRHGRQLRARRHFLAAPACSGAGAYSRLLIRGAAVRSESQCRCAGVRARFAGTSACETRACGNFGATEPQGRRRGVDLPLGAAGAVAFRRNMKEAAREWIALPRSPITHRCPADINRSDPRSSVEAAPGLPLTGDIHIVANAQCGRSAATHLRTPALRLAGGARQSALHGRGPGVTRAIRRGVRSFRHRRLFPSQV